MPGINRKLGKRRAQEDTRNNAEITKNARNDDDDNNIHTNARNECKH